MESTFFFESLREARGITLSGTTLPSRIIILLLFLLQLGLATKGLHSYYTILVSLIEVALASSLKISRLLFAAKDSILNLRH